MTSSTALRTGLNKWDWLFELATLLRPQPRSTPDAWAAANRSYPAHTGIPGPRNPYLTPYMVPWGRAIAEGRYRRAVMICGAQSGKTETLLDVIGERFDHQPAPILYVGPNKEFCVTQFEPRLMALFDEAPTLAKKLARGKRNKQIRKLIAGVPIRLAHAGSPTALKSDPAAIALVDEYDGMVKNLKDQGAPLQLIEARGFTYADFVTAIVSTPSLGMLDVAIDEQSGLEFWEEADPEDVQSPIWKLWQEGTRHHFAWPCPHCGEYFVPRFSCLKWDHPEDGTKTTPAYAYRTAYLACPRCGGVIEERHKTAMNAVGTLIATSVSPEGAVVLDYAKNLREAVFDGRMTLQAAAAMARERKRQELSARRKEEQQGGKGTIDVIGKTRKAFRIPPYSVRIRSSPEGAD